jgi:NAD(P)-dependent dehydrogenase (short-subunit alcohol dehydrogenase family)
MSSAITAPRTAIVTGGARRIGAALCRALAADGWHLVIHCHRSVGEAEALAGELGDSVVVTADLAQPDAGRAIFDAAAGLPPVRLLVNNASRFAHDSAEDFDPAEWDAHQAVNLRAPALLSQAFARQVDGEGGLIVNMLDAKLSHPNADFFSYTVSRYGAAGLTELLALAYASRGIRVCGIAPALTLLSGAQSPDNFEAMHRFNPLGRGVAVDDIVSALRFIIATPILTGQVITLDGGQRFFGLARDVQFLEQK